MKTPSLSRAITATTAAHENKHNCAIPHASELDAALLAAITALATTPPVSTSAEKCAREIYPKCDDKWLSEWKAYAAEKGFLPEIMADYEKQHHEANEERARIASVLARHFNGQGEDAAWVKASERVPEMPVIVWVSEGGGTALLARWHTYRWESATTLKSLPFSPVWWKPLKLPESPGPLRSAMSAQTQG